ncbi:endonuclease domain-containing protein [Angustibacter sp. McL0619]|uniref:endonuclease domain-containing protein n=1 Tax=Angustibacter sp. McL0619 TaxID=3415676 RepID=UPI003CF6CBBD
MTETQVDDMLERQAGLCPICRRGLGDKPHVDHDHETGEVRGETAEDVRADG